MEYELHYNIKCRQTAKNDDSELFKPEGLKSKHVDDDIMFHFGQST